MFAASKKVGKILVVCAIKWHTSDSRLARLPSNSKHLKIHETITSIFLFNEAQIGTDLFFVFKLFLIIKRNLNSTLTHKTKIYEITNSKS
jgi:hypothetical protein